MGKIIEIKKCKSCRGRGYVIWSCCGDEITDRLPENDICPTCGEHVGDMEKDLCPDCGATGVIDPYKPHI